MLAILISLDPVTASHVGAWTLGRPDIAPALVRICYRESRCQPIGLHAVDANRDPTDGWGGQVQLGHLRRWCQPYRPDTWSTRGAWGMSAASAWPYFPPCYQPGWLDIPVVGAIAAARRYLDRCDGRKKGWCPATRGYRSTSSPIASTTTRANRMQTSAFMARCLPHRASNRVPAP